MNSLPLPANDFPLGWTPFQTGEKNNLTKMSSKCMDFNYSKELYKEIVLRDGTTFNTPCLISCVTNSLLKRYVLKKANLHPRGGGHSPFSLKQSTY